MSPSVPTATTVGPDCQMTWREFEAAAEAEIQAGTVAWTYEIPGVAIAVVDADGSWAYAVAKGEGWR